MQPTLTSVCGRFGGEGAPVDRGGDGIPQRPLRRGGPGSSAVRELTFDECKGAADRTGLDRTGSSLRYPPPAITFCLVKDSIILLPKS